MHYTLPSNTCVLVFSLSSEKEALRKGIVNGTDLFRELTRQTIRHVEKTDLPFIHFNESLQKGMSFGERFTNAIQSVFDAGYENIITIGNDAPQLKSRHILEAHRLLLSGHSVLGPSVDGGFYLMGLHKKDFNASAFQQLPWQDCRLLHEISRLLSGEKTPMLLERLYDLDSERGIKLLLNRTQALSRRLLKLLLNLSASLSIYWFEISVCDAQEPVPLFNKGSPFVG